MKHIKDFLKLLNEERLPGIDDYGEITSWVNTKLDNDLSLRVSRFTKVLEEFSGIENITLNDKLKFLSDPNRGSNKYIQFKLSLLILLQFLKELKIKFHASSAGFLFEHYIAGLLHIDNSQHDEDYGIVDLTDGQINYQIKLYKEGSYIPYKEGCDRYIFGIKSKASLQINVYNLTNEDIETFGLLTGANKISLSRLEKLRYKKIVLKLDNIDNGIKQLSEKLQKTLQKMYEEISELNYNIETIIYGIDKHGETVITDKNLINHYYNLATENIKNIESRLASLTKYVISGYKRRI